MSRLSPRTRKVIRTTVTVVVVVAVAALFAIALARNWAAVQEQHLSFDARYVFAVVVFSAAVPVSGLLWGAILNRLSPDHRVSARAAMALHTSSWLLKYIPGQVGSLVNKVEWGRRNGYSRVLIVITFIYENVFLQLASIVPSVVIILATVGYAVFENNVALLVLPLLALIPLGLVIDRRSFHRVLDLPSRRMLKQPLPEEYFLPRRTSLALFVGFIVPRIINGIGFVLIAATVIPVEPADWLYLGASYAFAGAIGILAVLVPSGLGVREAVTFALLVAVGVEPAQAVIISLLARLLSTIADAVLALVYLVIRPPAQKEAVS